MSTFEGTNGRDDHTGPERTMIGRAGNDRLEYVWAPSIGDPYSINRDAVLFGGDGDDVLITESGNDRLLGGTGDDVLYSGGGIASDRLLGGDDRDTLIAVDNFGFRPRDVLFGGKGADRFVTDGFEFIEGFGVFDVSHAPRIMDFKSGTDLIRYVVERGDRVSFDYHRETGRLVVDRKTEHSDGKGLAAKLPKGTKLDVDTDIKVTRADHYDL